MKTVIADRFKKEFADSPITISSGQQASIDVMKQKLKDEFTLIPNPCPCKNAEPEKDVVISETDRYTIPLSHVLCAACGTIRIDPYLSPNDLSTFYTYFYQDMYGRSSDTSQYFDRQKQYGRKFLQLAGSYLKSRSSVLEFGCGAGGALDVFKAAGHFVYGVEYSDRLINFGKSKGLDNLYFGSVSDFVKKGHNIKFDLIYSNHVFEHIADPARYLNDCAQLLNPGGRIICSVPDIYNIHKYPFPNSDLKLMLHIAHVFNYSFKGLKIISDTLDMHIERLYPDEKVITPTSSMPELWFSISKGRSTEVIQGNVDAESAHQYLDYFLTTENNFVKKINLVKTEISLVNKIKNKLKQLILWKK